MKALFCTPLACSWFLFRKTVQCCSCTSTRIPSAIYQFTKLSDTPTKVRFRFFSTGEKGSVVRKLKARTKEAFVINNTTAHQRAFQSAAETDKEGNFSLPVADGSGPVSPTRPKRAAPGAWAVAPAGVARVRVRQHVNPLSPLYRAAIEPPDWSTVFEDPSRPLLLDIGCARGGFLFDMSVRHPSWNFLGVEIRKPLVDQANARVKLANLHNLHFLFGNINVSIDRLVTSLPPAVLHTVTVQFPDPWFKKRHWKRRVMQPALADAIARNLLPTNGALFIQSDVKEVAEHMVQVLSAHPLLLRSTPPHTTLATSSHPNQPPAASLPSPLLMTPRGADALVEARVPAASAVVETSEVEGGSGVADYDWLDWNPLGVATEREVSVLERGLAVYRAVFTRAPQPPHQHHDQRT